MKLLPSRWALGIRHIFMNDEMEYNRCQISDIHELKTPEDSEIVHKQDEESLKMRGLTMRTCRKCKDLGGGLPSERQPRLLPRMKLVEVLKVDLDALYKERMDQLYAND